MLNIINGVSYSTFVTLKSDRFNEIRRHVYARNKQIGDVEVLINSDNEFKYKVFDILGLCDNVIHLKKELI